MVIIQLYLAREKIIEINDIHLVGTPKAAGMGHLRFTVDSVSSQNNGFYRFHLLTL
jgi:hypothetical protein